MIRPYDPKDQEKLLAIFKLNTPKYFHKTEIEDFKTYLSENGNSYLTIEENNKILGGTGYFVNQKDKSGQITWIFFHPDYAGQGYGRQVVEFCLNALRKDKRVEKFTVRTSQLANGFFEKFGYRTTRVEKDYWGKGLDLYEMEMTFP